MPHPHPFNSFVTSHRKVEWSPETVRKLRALWLDRAYALPLPEGPIDVVYTHNGERLDLVTKAPKTGV